MPTVKTFSLSLFFSHLLSRPLGQTGKNNADVWWYRLWYFQIKYQDEKIIRWNLSLMLVRSLYLFFFFLLSDVTHLPSLRFLVVEKKKENGETRQHSARSWVKILCAIDNAIGAGLPFVVAQVATQDSNEKKKKRRRRKWGGELPAGKKGQGRYM